MKYVKYLGQILIFIGFAIIGNFIVDFLKLDIPGSIIGLLLVFLLLKSKILKLHWVEEGANFLLANLLIFFIPAAVGIIEYKNLIAEKGISLLFIILISTSVVMVSAGFLANKLIQLRKD